LIECMNTFGSVQGRISPFSSHFRFTSGHVACDQTILLLPLLICIAMPAWLIKILLSGDAIIPVHVWIEPVSTGSEAVAIVEMKNPFKSSLFERTKDLL
jgi:hypothetical protein